MTNPEEGCWINRSSEKPVTLEFEAVSVNSPVGYTFCLRFGYRVQLLVCTL